VRIAVLAVALGCGGFEPLPDDPAPIGTWERWLDLPAAGGERSYLVHVPARYEAASPRPLLVILHGGLSGGETLMGRTSFRALADQETLLLAFPNGWGLGPLLRHWNAGHCCGRAVTVPIDDVGFIDAVIADVAKHLNVDRSRIYVIGISNGGMLAYRYGALRSREIAGVAALASSIAGALAAEAPEARMPEPEATLPLIVFHGRADPRVPYADVAPSLAFWVERFGCNPLPFDEPWRKGQVTRSTWTGCAGDVQVQLFSLEGWGHSWPGPHFTNRLGEEHPLAGFDAVPILWDFFERQPKRMPQAAFQP
jgi:polyhydroxybutyrate depolymerase